MSESKLPWPGYRLREGWGVVAVGEILRAGDVCRGEEDGAWVDTRRVGMLVLSRGEPYFRRTDPNATLPPVEPIQVEPAQPEPGDDVRKALEIVSDTIADLRRERDALQKQVDAHEAARVDWMHEAELWSNKVSMLLEDRDALRKQLEKLTLEYSEACKENGIVRVERDALQRQVETLTADCEGLSLEKVCLENELHRMQSTPAAQAPASPVKPKRLEWGRWHNGVAQSTAPTRGYCLSFGDAGFLAHFDGVAIAGPLDTAAEIKAACQRHADETNRPTVAEQPKAESPAVEIQWPEWAIALMRNKSGGLCEIGRSRDCWVCTTFTGPDPFPPGLDWRKCYIINPACR